MHPSPPESIENKEKIYNYIKENPGIRISELKEKTKLPHKTIYKWINRLKNENKITVNEHGYMTDEYYYYLKKEEILNSTTPFSIDPWELTINYYKKNDYTLYERLLELTEKKGVFSKAMLREATSRLWSFGTQIKIQNLSANYSNDDLEIFNAVQELIKMLIRKSEPKVIDDTNMVISIRFDLIRAIAILLSGTHTDSFKEFWLNLHAEAARKIIDETKNPKGKPLGRKVVHWVAKPLETIDNATYSLFKTLKSKIDERNEDEKEST